MSVPYACYSDFAMAYTFNGVTPAQIDSYWLYHGSLRVNECFAHLYTTPFSSNNQTAKDLTIQFAALGIRCRTLNPEDSAELEKQVMARVTDITSGNRFMITTDGQAIQPDKNVLNQAWAQNQDYKPVFDMRDSEYQRIDPDRLQDNWDED